MLLFCVCIVTMAGLTNAFKPSAGIDDDSAMYTHMKITEEALDIVAATFLTSTDQVITTRTTEYDFVISSHFGADTNSYEKYKTQARQFAIAVSDAYKNFKTNADYTVNSERIREAHSIVQETRLIIGSLLMKSTLTDTDVALLRQNVAKCLLIIQSFYSNTNWVEMNGARPYSDFGSLGTGDLMRIASSEDKTCSSCDYTSSALRQGSCNDNLLVRDRLTSGYWSIHSAYPKPPAGSGETDGKCSHGGLWDSGKDTPATGGINKASTDPDVSPHYHLHQQASEAAVQATVEFFIHQTSGILTSVSNHMISQLIGLELKSTPSLGFAVDVTGSMSDDISDVKIALTKKVIIARNSAIVPSKYVLSTFSDPENLTTVKSTTDASEMIEWIDSLVASGGDDCPEYAMAGLQAAIRLSELNSRIFLATDADAKDITDANTAMIAAIAKNIKVEFLLTGSCSRRRRDVRMRHKRDLASFQSIAAGTGGGVYHIGSDELTTVLDKLLEDNFASSTAVVDYFVQTTAESDTMDIYVDSGADNLVIDIAGAYSLLYASLTDPKGTVENFSTDKATLYVSAKMTMTIQNPVTGTWVLSRLLSRQWEVNITVSSTLDISFQLVETDDFGIHYVSERNPIVGNNYTLAVIAYNLNVSSTSFAVNLLDEDGTVTYSAPVNMTFEASKTIGYTPIVIPDTNFYVQLSGIDQNGFQFKRMSGTSITPLSVDLFVQPIFESVAMGTPQDITYTLSNLGGSTETYTVMIVDDKGRVLSPTSRDHSMAAGTSVTENFQLLSATELEQITYTVSVTTLGSSDVLQSTTYTAMVTGPFCSSFMTSALCSDVITQSSNCSSFTWSATAVYSFDISVYAADDDVTVTIDSDNRTRLHVTGACCLANVTVNASPASGSGCQVTQLVTGRTMLQSVVNNDTSGQVTEPFCTSFMTSAVCSEAVTRSSNCSSFTWSATAVYSFDISVYEADDDVTVTIDTDNRTQLHVTGACCLANFTVNASPASGSGCQVTQLVTGRTMTQSVVNNDTSGQDDDDSYLTKDTGTNIGLIVGVLVGVGVLVLAVPGLLKYVTRKKDAGENDDVVDFEELPHADTSAGTKSDPKLLNFKALE